MFGLGFGELVMVAVMALIFIGPKKLPEVARNLGRFWRDFQDSIQGIKQEVHKEIKQEVATESSADIKNQQKVDEDNLPSA